MAPLLSPSTAARVLKAALARGGEFAEIFAEHRESSRVVLEDGRLEDVGGGANHGAGVRLVRDQREVYGHSNDTSLKALLEVASFLSHAVREEKKGARRAFAFRKSKAPRLPRARRSPLQTPLAHKVALAQRGERRARSFPHIKQVSSVLRDSVQRVLVANSLGEWAEDERTQAVYFVQAVAEKDGVVQTAYEPLGGTAGYELFYGDAPEEVAATAARRAALMIEAPKARGGPQTIVLSSSAGGTMIHEAVGHGLEADLAEEGLSVYAGKLGEPIASPLVSVVDDATLAHKRGSFRFDDEGTPSEKTVLVENGILRRYMQSRLTAIKSGAVPTGNGRRESYEYLPIVRMTNTLIAPGQDDPREIVRGVDRGLLVTRMGGGQVNTVNGDFVFEVSEGYAIEKGLVTHPVRGATLTGNGPKVLLEIDRVGSDLGFGIGTCGKDGQGVPVADAQPTIRIPELIVGGEA